VRYPFVPLASREQEDQRCGIQEFAAAPASYAVHFFSSFLGGAKSELSIVISAFTPPGFTLELELLAALDGGGAGRFTNAIVGNLCCCGLPFFKSAGCGRGDDGGGK
jgi:hypothetical protein